MLFERALELRMGDRASTRQSRVMFVVPDPLERRRDASRLRTILAAHRKDVGERARPPSVHHLDGGGGDAAGDPEHLRASRLDDRGESMLAILERPTRPKF